MNKKSQLPPFLLDIALYVISLKWSDAVIIPTIELYDKVVVYKDVDALSDQRAPNSLIEISADNEKLLITVDNSKDPVTAKILDDIRIFLDVAFGWGGPYSEEFAVVAQW